MPSFGVLAWWEETDDLVVLAAAGILAHSIVRLSLPLS